jgi:hypothetical protein
MFVTFELISGMCVGLQLITKAELDEGEGWFLIVELGIFRIIIEK